MVIRGNNIYSDVINKEKVNADNCIRVLWSKKYISLSAEKRKAMLWLDILNQFDI